MNTSKPSKPSRGTPVPGKIRNENTPLVSDNDILNAAFSVDKNPYLPSDFRRNLCQEMGNFRGYNLPGMDLPSVEALDSV